MTDYAYSNDNDLNHYVFYLFSFMHISHYNTSSTFIQYDRNIKRNLIENICECNN